MTVKIDFSRPDVLYSVIWVFVLLLITIMPIKIIVNSNKEVVLMIIGNIISFFVVYHLVRNYYNKKKRRKKNVLNRYNLILLKNYSISLFLLWSVGYLLTITYSEGMPIFWKYTANSKTYVDFGVPTFSGLLNTIRNFMIISFFLLLMVTKKKDNLFYLLIIIVSGFAEMSRGNLTVMILHAIGIWLLTANDKKKLFSKLFIMGISFVLLFGLLGNFRGEHNLNFIELVGEENIINELPLGFQWTYLYLTTPVNNVMNAYSLGIEPLYYPYYSLQTAIPTIIRNLFFPINGYPIKLAFEAFNATTFYGPLIADFGLWGASIVVVVIQFIVSVIHARAVNGSLFSILVYPSLFMCIIMSIFYMYFFSLIVLMFPVIIAGFLVYKKEVARI